MLRLLSTKQHDCKLTAWQLAVAPKDVTSSEPASLWNIHLTASSVRSMQQEWQQERQGVIEPDK